jgi:hypothetical protein
VVVWPRATFSITRAAPGSRSWPDISATSASLARRCRVDRPLTGRSARARFLLGNSRVFSVARLIRNREH